MAVELKVPSVGESISSVEIGDWLKAEGDLVGKDENVVLLDSEKATVELPAPVAGRLSKILKRKGESARIGDVIAEIDDHASAEAPPRTAPRTTPSPPVATTRPAEAQAPAEPRGAAPASEPPGDARAQPSGDRTEEAVRMSVWRRTIAKRLVQAQQEAALLTTFNEIDMTGVGDLRRTHGEIFQKKHRVKLGLMSFFVKAAVDALRMFPQVNAEVRGEDIVYRSYCDIGIAVSSSKGLVVPVLRGAELLSFAEVEQAIAEFARRANDSTLAPADLEGGTFTITNGGVFGSLASTPIVNPPQSAILGLHAIADRPVARDGQVVIRPMMYAALTYDHRIIDGREAVLFLGRVKDAIETPVRMLIDV
jgi:2-oxoglutarate dehydrogenase E2 component (dihydrolipoamide succinyltransferase)